MQRKKNKYLYEYNHPRLPAHKIENQLAIFAYDIDDTHQVRLLCCEVVIIIVYSENGLNGLNENRNSNGADEKCLD